MSLTPGYWTILDWKCYPIDGDIWPAECAGIPLLAATPLEITTPPHRRAHATPPHRHASHLTTTLPYTPPYCHHTTTLPHTTTTTTLPPHYHHTKTGHIYATAHLLHIASRRTAALFYLPHELKSCRAQRTTHVASALDADGSGMARDIRIQQFHSCDVGLQCLLSVF